MPSFTAPVAPHVAIPPGPQGRLSTTLAVALKPFAATERWRQKYGSTYATSVMGGDYFVTGDPNVVRDVFRAEPATLFPAGKDVLAPLTGPRSLFVLDPADHARERKLVTPPFQGSRMRAYADLIAEATLRRIETWQPGARVVALEETRTISAEVIVRAVFGVQDTARVALYVQLIARWIDAWRPIFILFPFARKRLAGLGPWARFVDTGAELDRLLNEDIGKRQASGARGDDILSMLLDSRYEDGSPLSPDSIRSHLRGLLFAGHETTMIAMAWMLQHLHANPEMLARTLTSIEGSVDEVLADPWLDAVVHETLRLYPIILGVVRRLAAPTQLGPYAVPADTNVWVSIVMLHTNPEVFPEPARFRPERFLEGSPRPYEYAPFGGGHRRCIGAAFAVMETKVVLMTILRRLQLELAGARTIGTSRRNISMAPAGGVPLRVVRWR